MMVSPAMLTYLSQRSPLFPGSLLLHAVLLLLLFIPNAPAMAETTGGDSTVTFSIRNFMVTGNTLLKPREIQELLIPYIGTGKTVDDVEKARSALEKLYHDKGYPSVLVNIPEQTIEDGIVMLQVVESRIGRVRVKGNRYFTREKILSDLPCLQPGAILYLPDLKRELAMVNRNPDLSVAPQLRPGRDPGTIDVILLVKDHLPLHGSLELNNRASPDTTDLRLNGEISYDNLWQKEHSVSLQYQVSPEDTSEVEVVAASYVMPAPWDRERYMVFYGIMSDSNTAFGQGFQVTGKGNILGIRYIIPLPAMDQYIHSINLGLDYKDFDEELVTGPGGESVLTPIKYMPASVSYSATLFDPWGQTHFSAGLNMGIRGLAGRQQDFEIKRYRAKANYILTTLGVERHQKLPFRLGLFIKLDGQIADSPLISNEQYMAGGMTSVRGYLESEIAGDDAFHLTAELLGPELVNLPFLGRDSSLQPYIFYDRADLWLQDALPGQDNFRSISGIGGGIKGGLLGHLDYELSYGYALDQGDPTDQGDSRINFLIKAHF